MKRLAFILVFFMCVRILTRCFATDVIVNLSEFNAWPTTNRTVTIQQLQPFAGNLIPYNSGTNGYFYLSNAPISDYAMTVQAAGVNSAKSFQFTVTATNLGLIDAVTNTTVIGVSTYPQAGSHAWTILASDARYAFSGSAGSNMFYPLIGNPSNFQSSAQVSNSINAATNGLVGSSITNGLASTNYVNTATNGFVGNSVTNQIYGFTTNLVTISSNGIVAQIPSTNGFATTNYVNTATNTAYLTLSNSIAAINAQTNGAAFLPASQRFTGTNIFTRPVYLGVGEGEVGVIGALDVGGGGGGGNLQITATNGGGIDIYADDHLTVTSPNWTVDSAGNAQFISITNGSGLFSLGNDGRVNAGLFAGNGGLLTNLNYNGITNPPVIPSTNGFVNSSVTNQLYGFTTNLTTVTSNGAVSYANTIGANGTNNVTAASNVLQTQIMAINTTTNAIPILNGTGTNTTLVNPAFSYVNLLAGTNNTFYASIPPLSEILGGNQNQINGSAGSNNVIVGGAYNLIGVSYGGNNFVAGLSNTAAGGSPYGNGGDFALGIGASANHSDSFVWSDGTPFADSAAHQFLIHASGGVGIGTATLGGNALEVAGNVDSTVGFSINGTPVVAGSGISVAAGTLITASTNSNVVTLSATSQTNSLLATNGSIAGLTGTATNNTTGNAATATLANAVSTAISNQWRLDATNAITGLASTAYVQGATNTAWLTASNQNNVGTNYLFTNTAALLALKQTGSQNLTNFSALGTNQFVNSNGGISTNQTMIAKVTLGTSGASFTSTNVNFDLTVPNAVNVRAGQLNALGTLNVVGTSTLDSGAATSDGAGNFTFNSIGSSGGTLPVNGSLWASNSIYLGTNQAIRFLQISNPISHEISLAVNLNNSTRMRFGANGGTYIYTTNGNNNITFGNTQDILIDPVSQAALLYAGNGQILIPVPLAGSYGGFNDVNSTNSIQLNGTTNFYTTTANLKVISTFPAGGTYIQTDSTHYTNYFTGAYIVNSSGSTWALYNSGGSTLNVSSTGVINASWSIVGGAACTSQYGDVFDNRGVTMIGDLSSTSMVAQVNSIIDSVTNGSSTNVALLNRTNQTFTGNINVAGIMAATNQANVVVETGNTNYGDFVFGGNANLPTLRYYAGDVYFTNGVGGQPPPAVWANTFRIMGGGGGFVGVGSALTSLQASNVAAGSGVLPSGVLTYGVTNGAGHLLVINNGNRYQTFDASSLTNCDTNILSTTGWAHLVGSIPSGGATPTFNSSQFASGSSGTNLPSGILLTNSVTAAANGVYQSFPAPASNATYTAGWSFAGQATTPGQGEFMSNNVFYSGFNVNSNGAAVNTNMPGLFESYNIENPFNTTKSYDTWRLTYLNPTNLQAYDFMRFDAIHGVNSNNFIGFHAYLHTDELYVNNPQYATNMEPNTAQLEVDLSPTTNNANIKLAGSLYTYTNGSSSGGVIIQGGALQVGDSGGANVASLQMNSAGGYLNLTSGATNYFNVTPPATFNGAVTFAAAITNNNNQPPNDFKSPVFLDGPSNRISNVTFMAGHLQFQSSTPICFSVPTGTASGSDLDQAIQSLNANADELDVEPGGVLAVKTDGNSAGSGRNIRFMVLGNNATGLEGQGPQDTVIVTNSGFLAYQGVGSEMTNNSASVCLNSSTTAITNKLATANVQVEVSLVSGTYGIFNNAGTYLGGKAAYTGDLTWTLQPNGYITNTASALTVNVVGGL